MTLQERLMEDMKAALKRGDERRLSVIRFLRSAIHYAEVDRGGPLDDQGVLGVIARQVKQRKESIEEFGRGHRPDLVEREGAELAILQEYLPPQASLEEVEAAVLQAVAQVGAQGQQDMGRVMSAVMAQLRGRAEGRLVSQVVQEFLSKM